MTKPTRNVPRRRTRAAHPPEPAPPPPGAEALETAAQPLETAAGALETAAVPTPAPGAAAAPSPAREAPPAPVGPLTPLERVESVMRMSRRALEERIQQGFQEVARVEEEMLASQRQERLSIRDALQRAREEFSNSVVSAQSLQSAVLTEHARTMQEALVQLGQMQQAVNSATQGNGDGV